MNGLENIADIVHFHRKRSGLTQAALANMAGVGKTAVFDIEKGKRSVQLDTITKVFSVLNIRMEFISPLMGEFKSSNNETEKL
jgi:HTH-type transcriptional regulator / antitoxin HipB